MMKVILKQKNCVIVRLLINYEVKKNHRCLCFILQFAQTLGPALCDVMCSGRGSRNSAHFLLLACTLFMFLQLLEVLLVVRESASVLLVTISFDKFEAQAIL